MDIEQMLKRYVEIQAQEKALREEKTRLQEQLADHLRQLGKETWVTQAADQALKVRRRASTRIEYDEVKLHDRLGDRYRRILAPDLRKLKQHMEEAAPLLEPLMERVGAPSPDRIREAMNAGVVTKEEFAGAFTKSTREIVSVSRTTGFSEG